MTTSTMTVLQIACFAIVGLWLAVRLAREERKVDFVAKLLVIATAAWMGEETCIRLYAFYDYAPRWWLFLDDVPVAIVCIWPVVVVSSMDLARRLRARPLVFACAVMGLVVADASLIEPIAVASRLWQWNEPGPFSVPIIGVLGWGFFAFGVALVDALAVPALALAAGPLATHGLLLATWWGALRWLPRGEDARPFVVVALVVSVALSVSFVLRKVEVPRADLLSRVPAASFFFVLLALFARSDVALVAYALAFAPPYLVLTARSWSSTTAGARPQM
jgi:hypothetical protein